MLHAKFKDHRFFKCFYIDGRGGHLPFLQNICCFFPWRLQIKFGFDWSSGFREDV